MSKWKEMTDFYHMRGHNYGIKIGFKGCKPLAVFNFFYLTNFHFMKQKLVLTFLFLAIGVSIGFAQSSSQNATLTVIINQSISLTLNDVNPTLVFDEASDFVNGVSYAAQNAGEVTATRPYDLSVLAAANVISDGSGNTIPVGSVAVEATATSGGTASQVNLTTNAQTIINNAPAGLNQPFGLTYSTAANDANFLSVPDGSYTVTLTYTATLD